MGSSQYTLRYQLTAMPWEAVIRDKTIDRDDRGYTKDSFEDFQKESILSSYKLLSQSLMAAS